MKLSSATVELRRDGHRGVWWYIRLEGGQEYQYPVDGDPKELGIRLAAQLLAAAVTDEQVTRLREEGAL